MWWSGLGWVGFVGWRLRWMESGVCVCVSRKRRGHAPASLLEAEVDPVEHLCVYRVRMHRRRVSQCVPHIARSRQSKQA